MYHVLHADEHLRAAVAVCIPFICVHAITSLYGVLQAVEYLRTAVAVRVPFISVHAITSLYRGVHAGKYLRTTVAVCVPFISVHVITSLYLVVHAGKYLRTTVAGDVPLLGRARLQHAGVLVRTRKHGQHPRCLLVGHRHHDDSGLRRHGSSVLPGQAGRLLVRYQRSRPHRHHHPGPCQQLPAFLRLLQGEQYPSWSSIVCTNGLTR